MSEPPLITTRGLRKSFCDNEILRGIDLDVRAGEVVCLLGPSGSGKSTLLRCLNLLEAPDAGEITFAGKLVRPGPEADAHRRQVGMVFQRFNLFPHLTVLQNLTLAPREVLGLGADEAEALGCGLLERVGLGGRERAWPHELSGGQQQRVAIARALAMKPRVMLFDEVTSALDPELVGEVLAVMRDLAKGGMTMVVVTHLMSFARDVGKRVVFLDGGVVVECGEAASTLRAPRTERLKEFLGQLV